MLSLANTKASGRRWMIVGFDNSTRGYQSAPDANVTQDRIEQILAHYTDPVVIVRYEMVQYRSGAVGKLEVLREPANLPYKVARSIGDRKRIEAGQVFVRHGSQIEAPTQGELDSLIEEGKSARAHSA